MKIWKLKLLDTWGLYDISAGFVIRAETEREARQIAAQKGSGHMDEDFWLSADNATCEEVLPSGESGVILEDFKRG